MSTCLKVYTDNTPVPLDTTTLERVCMGIDSTGNALSYDTWKSAWQGPLSDGRSCVQLFNDTINSLGGNTIFNPFAFTRVSAEYEYMLSKYFNNRIGGHNITLPGQVGYDTFQNNLLKSCRDVPGACNAAQAKLCNGCTRSAISNSPDLITLCGCYAPVLDPAIYKRAINIPCDPLCRQELAAKRRDPSAGGVPVCNDTVCVIDNIAITAVKSSLNGVSIDQVCPGCSSSATGGKGCTCVVDTSVVNLGSSLGLNDPNSVFTQYCPPEFSTCIVIDSQKGTSTVIPCGSRFGGATKPKYDSSIPLIVYIILIIIVVIVLLALAAYVYTAATNRIFIPVRRDLYDSTLINTKTITSTTKNI